MDWEPITKKALQARVAQGIARMTDSQRRLWRAMEVDPLKWEQHPYGEQGGGFWVVGILGGTVIWYNDVEEGFNRSAYSKFGIIDEYFCNQDELELTVQYVASYLEGGHDLVRLLAEYRMKRRCPVPC